MGILEDLRAVWASPGSDPSGWTLPSLDAHSAVLRAELDLPTYGYHSGHSIDSNRLRKIRQWIEAGHISTDGNSVFTDVTTISSAMHFMSTASRGGHMVATTLMDLDTFARSAILSDRIYHLDRLGDDYSEINQNIGENVVAALGVAATDDDPVSATLRDLFDECRSTVRSLTLWPEGSSPWTDAEQLRTGWEILLGRPIDAGSISGAAADGQRWASAGGWNVAKMISLQRGNPQGIMDDDSANFIEECNIRALFNMRIAGVLNLPYAANSSRLPVTYRRFSNAAAANNFFLDIQEVQDVVNRQISEASRPLSMKLPVFLATILMKCDRPDQILGEIGSWRQRAEPYRVKRAELLAALRDGDVKTVKRLRRAVDADIGALAKAATPDLADAVLAPAFAATGHGIAALILATFKMLKVVTGVDENARTAIVNRIARRDMWFISKISDAATSYGNSLARVQLIWGISDRKLDECSRTLERMRALDSTWRDFEPNA